MAAGKLRGTAGAQILKPDLPVSMLPAGEEQRGVAGKQLRAFGLHVSNEAGEYAVRDSDRSDPLCIREYDACVARRKGGLAGIVTPAHFASLPAIEDIEVPRCDECERCAVVR
ncbi:MAG TPA: hypothetical protein VHB50_05730, partial [Bryobacteraceae bacterium]|nr:hypothetical protein [Bryobacteraceae bacterium]